MFFCSAHHRRAEDGTNQVFYEEGKNLTNFLSWGVGEPNDHHSGEHCLAMHKSGGWRDVSCASKLDVVCQMACTNATSE